MIEVRSAHEFCAAVGQRVEREYGYLDGSDLCFALLEMRTIFVTDGEERCAQIVAQHLAQQ